MNNLEINEKAATRGGLLPEGLRQTFQLFFCVWTSFCYPILLSSFIIPTFHWTAAEHIRFLYVYFTCCSSLGISLHRTGRRETGGFSIDVKIVSQGLGVRRAGK